MNKKRRKIIKFFTFLSVSTLFFGRFNIFQSEVEMIEEIDGFILVNGWILKKEDIL